MNRDDYLPIIERALAEDLGELGDLTTQAVVPADAQAIGEFVVRGGGVVAGLDVAAAVFDKVDGSVRFTPLVGDGDHVAAGEVIARVEGRAGSILTAERTALNLLGRMCGVATETARLVEKVSGTGASISDTRKTMPGMRALDKYAVRAGGGVNHRMGLYDAVMIKDNHIVAAGDIRRAVEQARALVGRDVMIEVEVENLDQLSEVLQTDADRVLLDNMDPVMLEEAVAIVGDAIETEASGGVTMETVAAIAKTGVDIISVGWITHSPPQMDIGLDFVS